MKANFWFQKKLRYPTEYQLARWEDEGGALQELGEEGYVINGRLCFGPTAKIKNMFYRLMRSILGFFPKQHKNENKS